MRFVNAALTIAIEKYKDWPRALPLVLFAYRTALHETTGYSPFYLTFGRPARLPLDAALEEGSEECEQPQSVAINEYVRRMRARLKDAYARVRRAQLISAEKNAKRLDVGRIAVTFKPGDAVLLWDPKSSSGTVGTERKEYQDLACIPAKWRFRWSGPHLIVAKRGENTYVVRHAGLKRDVVFNVALLIRYYPFSDSVSATDEEKVSTDKDKPEMEIEEIEENEPAAVKGVSIPRGGDVLALRPGHLYAIALHDEPAEPLVIARFLRMCTEEESARNPGEGQMVVQWLGSLQANYRPEDKMETQRWLNGWFSPATREYYWRDKPSHYQHVEYTNLLTDHQVFQRNVLCGDFGLNRDMTLKRSVARLVLRLWQQRVAEGLYSGEVAQGGRSTSLAYAKCVYWMETSSKAKRSGGDSTSVKDSCTVTGRQ